MFACGWRTPPTNLYPSQQYGRTPLYMACFCEQLDVVEFLVHNGATINKNLDDYVRSGWCIHAFLFTLLSLIAW